MKYNLLLLIFSLISSSNTSAIEPVWNEKELKIDNGTIKRIISFEEGKITTLSLRLPDYPYNFVSIEEEEPDGHGLTNHKYGIYHPGANPEEFSFNLNDKRITGNNKWNILSVKDISEGESPSFLIVAEGTDDSNKDVGLELYYYTYPNLPIIRKKICIENRGNTNIKIDNIDIESLTIPWSNTHNIVFQNYARYKHLGPYIGDWDDAAMILHDQYTNRGILLGNEAPGVIKRTTSCLDGRTYTIGLIHNNQDFPSRVWLEPGEKWESPLTFIAPYNNDNPRAIVDNELSTYVRQHMGIRLTKVPVKPTFVYNTWQPFRYDINAKLIKELADAAADCGVKEFVIDDGWQVNYGDWEIDYKKFPGGLKPVFDYIKSKGMKPGLWLTLSTASVNSKVYKNHPDWFIKNRNQETVDLIRQADDRRTACFTTAWKDQIKSKIIYLVKEHGLEYLKLDFPVATSAYSFDRTVTGCYADNHLHHDREESFLMIYRAAWKLFDELHEEAPNLFIDCTFETMGALQLIDYDMCKHAEGNWLSNFEEKPPLGSLRVRQMAWWRTPVMPATALVIGNQSIDDDLSLFSFKSLMGTLPIMLGDLRKMDPIKRNEFQLYAKWFQEMQDKYNIMMYRQDLPGFGEPSVGGWDGFQRINTDNNSGGIIGVFKQNSNENQRLITINFLESKKIYEVKEAVTKKRIALLSGEDLRQGGFIVNLNNIVDAVLFEISEVNRTITDMK